MTILNTMKRLTGFPQVSRRSRLVGTGLAVGGDPALAAGFAPGVDPFQLTLIPLDIHFFQGPLSGPMVSLTGPAGPTSVLTVDSPDPISVAAAGALGSIRRRRRGTVS